ncbi:hypothetical protein IQ254_19920 [Nodosilinea sp. LEGE 07088]|uniref:sulfotransferase n=1 Tax=Nodosilinea sp. LEGE 07088 TaxID=2777968 RepID=UPI001881F097|nr:sulfotransferase [Nodosilinea sp. LEGE 07088]MBE9139436.1 hypothetical protein [Nodosilinea sp. LEGE 07088]
MPKKFTKAVKSRALKIPAIRAMLPRRAHAYCIGTAKSGTHSIEAIFRGNLRCAHESESHQVIDFILDIANNNISDDKVQRYILERDQKLRLEVDSSQLNYFLLDQLLILFPKSKFLLTIRDPYAWLDSFINHQLGRQASEHWLRLRDFRFKPELYSHPKEEATLRDKGLYTLDGYLSYWSEHNQNVINTVPKDRLLIVQTSKINEKSKEIAKFIGVSDGKIVQRNSHAFKAKQYFNVLSELDQQYLESKVDFHCRDLLSEFFPDICSDSVIR